LAIERQVIEDLAGDHLGDEAEIEAAPRHGTRRRFDLLHAAVFLRAGIFGRHEDLHHDLGRPIIDPRPPLSAAVPAVPLIGCISLPPQPQVRRLGRSNQHFFLMVMRQPSTRPSDDARLFRGPANPERSDPAGWLRTGLAV
jgi:hypothetical protein